MTLSISQSLVLVALVQEIGIFDFKKVSETLNQMYGTTEFTTQGVESEYNIISQNKKLQVGEVISSLNASRIIELKTLLQQSTLEKDSERTLPVLITQKEAFEEALDEASDNDENDENDDNEMDIVETPRKSARFLLKDEKSKRFKSACLLVLDKITDHKTGNLFLRRIKELDYEDVVKVPMYLDLVKARIKDGTIKNVIDFHRDLTLICANAVMYNQEGSDIYNMALEFKEFIDLEIQLLVDLQSDS